MIIDNNLFFADAQAATQSAASTNVVDTLAAGDAYVGAFFCVRIDTAYVAAAGAPTAEFQLQSYESSEYDGITLNSSGALLAASLTAGRYIVKMRIPPGARRYLRAYLKVTESGGNTFAAGGKFDAFITHDADMPTNLQEQ